MSKLFYDKKASEKVFSIWWVGMMLIVGAGIVFATMMFYSTYSDINAIESEIMAGRTQFCIESMGVEFFEGNVNLLTSCGFAISSFEGRDYFLQVFIDGDEKYVYGNKDIEIHCGLRKGLKGAKYYAECSEKEFNFQGKNINIVAGSNSVGEVVKNA